MIYPDLDRLVPKPALSILNYKVGRIERVTGARIHEQQGEYDISLGAQPRSNRMAFSKAAITSSYLSLLKCSRQSSR